MFCFLHQHVRSEETGLASFRFTAASCIPRAWDSSGSLVGGGGGLQMFVKQINLRMNGNGCK